MMTYTLLIKGICNTNCAFCNFYEFKKGVEIDTHYDELIQEIDIAVLNGYEAVNIGINGYEPTAFPRFNEILVHIKRRNLRVTLFTNGAKLSDLVYMEEISPFLDTVCITLYSSNNREHALLTQNNDSYLRKHQAIENCLKTGIEVSISILLLKPILGSLPIIIEQILPYFDHPLVDKKLSIVNPDCCMGERNALLIAPVTSIISELRDLLRSYGSCFSKKGIRLRLNENFFRCLIDFSSEIFEFTYSDHKKNKRNISEDIENRVYLDRCNKCAFLKICSGIQRRYIEIYGSEEFDGRVISNQINLGLFGKELEKIRKHTEETMKKSRDYLLKEKSSKQNRHWVRISSVCNNKCLFCLDSEAQDGHFIDDAEVRKSIDQGLEKGVENRLILSGGEASINPRFSEYIRYGKELGYNRIQTITNGNRFADLAFCREVFSVGLDEVTFSMHGHTDRLHDYLVDTPGAFRKSIQGIINIRKFFPDVILNIDIVVNKVNVGFLPDIVRFFMKLGILEFDILQIIPFGRGFSEYRSELFYDPQEYLEPLRRTWELSRLPGVHMWTNRFPPEVLEGYESLIQDPGKIRSEVMGEGRAMFEDFIRNGVKPHCFGERCNACFQQQFCLGRMEMIEKKTELLQAIPSVRGRGSLSEVYADFGDTSEEFLGHIAAIRQRYGKDPLNIPRCLGGGGIYEHAPSVSSLEDYTDEYIKQFYRKKSLRCKHCKYNTECKGIHINFIRAYGFSILKPLT